MNEAEKEIHIKRYEENIKRIQSEIESLALYIDKKKTELKMWENAKNNK
jgi:DNA polymerase III delta subunit